MFEILEAIYIPSTYTLYVSMMLSMVLVYLFYIDTKAHFSKRSFNYVEKLNIRHVPVQANREWITHPVFAWLAFLYRNYESSNDDEDSFLPS